ncbi:MAG TPA: matrixin family metalloprotease [Gemmatimonadaceae bacterium]
MGRADVVLIAAVATFATFVGAEVATRPVRVTRAVQQQADEAADSPDVAADTADAASDTHAELSANRRPSDQPEAPDRSPAEVRGLIGSATGTYMTDMLADLHGSLVRWPDRRGQGLRVWVQSMSSVHDWDLRYAQMARDAFDAWDVDLPIRFDFVIDSATSDVRITWTDRFAPELGRRVGVTNRRSDHHGWLVEANITIAIHDSTGQTIPPADLAGIVRHEAGHALGLGHSKDPRTIMFPIETGNGISPADRATLKLLYELPPGLVR